MGNVRIMARAKGALREVEFISEAGSSYIAGMDSAKEHELGPDSLARTAAQTQGSAGFA